MTNKKKMLIMQSQESSGTKFTLTKEYSPTDEASGYSKSGNYGSLSPTMIDGYEIELFTAEYILGIVSTVITFTSIPSTKTVRAYCEETNKTAIFTTGATSGSKAARLVYNGFDLIGDNTSEGIYHVYLEFVK